MFPSVTLPLSFRYACKMNVAKFNASPLYLTSQPGFNLYSHIYIYMYIYVPEYTRYDLNTNEDKNRSEGFALTGYVVPGCVEDGTWMLWENSSAAVAVAVARSL